MEKLSSFFRPSPSLHSTSDHGINLAFLFSETVSNPPLMVALAEDPECEDPQEKVFCDLTAQRRPSGFPPIASTALLLTLRPWDKYLPGPRVTVSRHGPGNHSGSLVKKALVSGGMRQSPGDMLP